MHWNQPALFKWCALVSTAQRSTGVNKLHIQKTILSVSVMLFPEFLSEKGERKLKENQQFVAHPCRTLYDNAVIFYQTIVTDRVQ